MGTHPIFESDFDCLTEENMDEREKRDAEINKALEEAKKLIQGTDSVQVQQEHEDDIDDIINMVKSIDVDKALNDKKISSIVNLEERTDFAAHLEEIESRVDENQLEEVEVNEDDIRLDPRMPKEGRERFLRARCRVLQDEVNRLQKEYQQTNDKWHQARRQAQDRAEHITKLEKTNEKQRKEFDKLKLASEKEVSKATEAEQKFQSIKRELDDVKLKNKKQKVSQNDVRLQRALEEVKKYKNELNDALRRNRDIGEVKKHEFGEIEKEKNKFKKINSELKIIIQKQSKLVEVLRKKCAHLEAARVLEFTEEEFMKALDWQNE